MLEGEAYVLAAGVGTTVGYSWLTRPAKISRVDSFTNAFKRDMNAYFFVLLLLIAAAAVESATITLVHL
jgi:hypothetical protein